MRLCGIAAFTWLMLSTFCMAADEPSEILLWPGGAPGSEGITAGNVVVDRGKDGSHIRSVTQVHKPSLTVYLPPKEKATGAAVVICPGGGHRMLAIEHEGHDIAKWFNQIGVAGFVLQYRLARARAPSTRSRLIPSRMPSAPFASSAAALRNGASTRPGSA